MKLNIEIEKNLNDVIGKPIEFKQGSGDFIGTVTDYNKETGQATLEVEESRIKEIFPSMAYLISSRKKEDL